MIHLQKTLSFNKATLCQKNKYNFWSTLHNYLIYYCVTFHVSEIKTSFNPLKIFRAVLERLSENYFQQCFQARQWCWNACIEQVTLNITTHIHNKEQWQYGYRYIKFTVHNTHRYLRLLRPLKTPFCNRMMWLLFSSLETKRHNVIP